MWENHQKVKNLVLTPITPSLEDLPEATLQRVKNFFETYKTLEPGKWVKVKEYKGKEEAAKMLQAAIDAYKK